MTDVFECCQVVWVGGKKEGEEMCVWKWGAKEKSLTEHEEEE